MTTALQKAIKGEKVSEAQAPRALAEAVDRITSLSKRAAKAKEVVAATGEAAIATAEMQGAVVLSSVAEGYFGQPKMEVAGIDLRAPVGLLTLGFGFYQMATGGGGEHALALGNGVTASWVASLGRRAGERLATPQGKTFKGRDASGNAIFEGGAVREVMLSPEPSPRRPRMRGEEEEAEAEPTRPQRRRRMGMGRRGRFARTQAQPA
ncbi:hypothetical protein L6R50_08890 [Myxococcota bacterium]|nr:hypothetical protein [Myxococcota bacterium]